MPTYEYTCSACEENFEIFHGMTESAPSACPSCGAERSLRKLLSAGSGLIFKGSGFYITDYKKDGAKESSGEKKPSETKSETSPKTETKESKPTESKSKDSQDMNSAAAA